MTRNKSNRFESDPKVVFSTRNAKEFFKACKYFNVKINPDNLEVSKELQSDEMEKFRKYNVVKKRK